MAHAGDRPNEPCRRFEQDLVLYHYGESTEKERYWLETHLKKCDSCRDFLADLRGILPLTAKTDDLPSGFWESYSKEMSQKLAVLEPKIPKILWWSTVRSLFQSWPVPAFTAALVLIMAITVTFSKGLWQTRERFPEEKALEIQPVTEDLDFLKSLDFLDSLDLLEAADTGKRRPGDA